MPNLQTPNLLPPMAGLAMLSQISQMRERNSLALQKLREQEQTAQEQQLLNQMRLEQGDKRLQEMSRYHDMQMAARDVVDQRVKLRQERLDQANEAKIKSDAQDTDRLIEMQGKIYGIDAKKGTNDWFNQFNDIANEYSDVTGTPEAKRILTPIQNQYKTARTEGFNAFLGKARGNGITTFGIFDNPQLFQGADDAKGNMVFKLPNDKGVITDVPVPKPLYDDLKNKYQEYYGTGSAPVRSDAHVNAWSQAKAAQKDPNVDPVKLKAIYAAKGFNPNELDSDNPP